MRGPELNVWRAPTENDALSGAANEWRKAGLHALRREVTGFEIKPVRAQIVQVIVNAVSRAAKGPAVFETAHTYTVYGSGDVLIEMAVKPGASYALPRLGVQMRVTADFRRLQWYGRGPQETYPDRKLGGAVGEYREMIEVENMPYVVPQEYGNKSDVRWAALTNADGIGLAVFGLPVLQFSAHPFDTHTLEEAMHTFTLLTRSYISLNLDFEVCGLGNGSCGPGTLPQYQVQARPASYTVRLRPISKNDAPVMDLWKQVLPHV